MSCEFELPIPVLAISIPGFTLPSLPSFGVNIPGLNLDIDLPIPFLAISIPGFSLPSLPSFDIFCPIED